MVKQAPGSKNLTLNDFFERSRPAIAVLVERSASCFWPKAFISPVRASTREEWGAAVSPFSLVRRLGVNILVSEPGCDFRRPYFTFQFVRPAFEYFFAGLATGRAMTSFFSFLSLRRGNPDHRPGGDASEPACSIDAGFRASRRGTTPNGDRIAGHGCRFANRGHW